MSDPILTVEGVETDIAQYHILKGVDLQVPRGQVTMLLGRNGVGKTTTLRTIMGLWRNKAGRIGFDGRDLNKMPIADRCRAGIGFVPEDMGIFAALTVEENMTLAALSGPLDPARKDWLFATFPPLRTFWKSPAGTLSGGQKQMLSIARAMAEAQPVSDRRTDQGAGPGHRVHHGARAARVEGAGRVDTDGRTEFRRRQGAGRPRCGDG